MRDLSDLTEADLRSIVRRIHHEFYFDSEAGREDRDRPVNGGDLVEVVGAMFALYDLVPDAGRDDPDWDAGGDEGDGSG